jgi:hypothetical protein
LLALQPVKKKGAGVEILDRHKLSILFWRHLNRFVRHNSAEREVLPARQPAPLGNVATARKGHTTITPDIPERASVALGEGEAALGMTVGWKFRCEAAGKESKSPASQAGLRIASGYAIYQTI